MRYFLMENIPSDKRSHLFNKILLQGLMGKKEKKISLLQLYFLSSETAF